MNLSEIIAEVEGRLPASLLLVEVLMNLSDKKNQMFPAPGCFGTNAFWIRSRSNAAGTVPVFA